MQVSLNTTEDADPGPAPLPPGLDPYDQQTFQMSTQQQSSLISSSNQQNGYQQSQQLDIDENGLLFVPNQHNPRSSSISNNSQLEQIDLNDNTNLPQQDHVTPDGLNQTSYWSRQSAKAIPSQHNPRSSSISNSSQLEQIDLNDSTNLPQQDHTTPDGLTQTSYWSRQAAKARAHPTTRFTTAFLHNVYNKVEDIAIVFLGVTDVIAEAGGGVGRTAVSGVGAVGAAVEGGVSSAFARQPSNRKLNPRQVDTITQVDISGTILKDLNRAIEVENMRGTNNAESPLNTPWILMIFPLFPIVFMYTKTALQIALPPIISFIVSVWTFFGWRFWLCFVILMNLIIIILWDTIKNIGPLRPITMQVDVMVIQFRRKIAIQLRKQMPKIYKALDRIFPPIIAALIAVDKLLTPKFGYSPLLAINAKINGWVHDPKIEEIRIKQEGAECLSNDSKASLQNQYEKKGSKVSGASNSLSTVSKRDRGEAVVMTERGATISPPGQSVSIGGGLEFDSERITENIPETSTTSDAIGELFEQYFNLEIHLKELSELHRKYTSVWVEWIFRGMVVDRSVIRDVSQGNNENWKGFGTSFDGYNLTGEVRLPLRANTTQVKGGFYDVPVKLVLKGRDGLPIYANDGARRYMRNSPKTVVIGEIELSATRIGVGADPEGIIRSELRIPLHAFGCSQYRAAVLHASARITPIDSSSYSYRQMLSQLPNGEWTVRVNVFELRNLKGVDNSGSSDPYVSAQVMGIVKKTDRQRQTLSCMVNQLLFFSKVRTGLEFEDEKITIEVFDWNRLGAAKKIGTYTFDAKRILELPGRELYRKWFALQDPNGGKRPAGFIKMSITVVPPGEVPPHHDETEDTEELSKANLLKNQVLKTPKMSYQNWAVHITVGWADMLPRMASPGYRDAIRGYVTFNYSGWDEQQTKTFIGESKPIRDNNIGSACRVLPQRRIIWNEEYILPLTVINDRVAQEGINLKLFHRIMPRLQEPVREDQLIGQVSVSFEELFKNMTTAVVRGDPADDEEDGDRIHKVAMMKPRYYNFYGTPEGNADPYDKGVAFRGRVLVGAAAKPGDLSAPFLRPCPPPPRPKLEFYKLDFSILRVTELPLKDGWSVYVECRIGLYVFGSTIPKANVRNQCAEWDENCAVSIPNMQFPEDVEQIPDLFVTIWARKPKTVAELEEKEEHDTVPGRMRGKTTSPTANDGTVDLTTGPHQGNTQVAAPNDTEHSTDQGRIHSQNASTQGDAAAPATAHPTTSFNPSHSSPEDEDEDARGDGLIRPKAFIRLTGKHLICDQKDPRWMFMDYPGNDVLNTSENEVPGSILVSASLSRYDPTMQDVVDDAPSIDLTQPQQIKVDSSSNPSPTAPDAIGNTASTGPVPEQDNGDIRSSEQKALATSANARSVSVGKSNTYTIPLGGERLYTLRALVIQGRNLPAADASGLSDPTFVVSMGDKKVHGNSICLQTVSPMWGELVEVKNIRIRDGERKPNVNVLIYDYNEMDSLMTYLGRSIIPCAELDTAEPTIEFSKWYPIFSVNPAVIVGEILADFQLIPSEIAIERPLPEPPKPVLSESALRISLVGLRDVKFLQYASGEIFVECAISSCSMKPVPSKSGAILQQRAFEANCNILDILILKIEIPEDLRLAPALNVYVYADYNHSTKPELVATACVPLDKWLSEYNRRLLTGESLIDDSFGMDAPVPDRLFQSNKNYQFRRNARRVKEEVAGPSSSLRLHEVKSQEHRERMNVIVLKEKQDVRRVGFVQEKSKEKGKTGKITEKETPPGASIGEKIAGAFAPIRAMKYKFADNLADIMPDIANALGIEVDEDVPLSALLGNEDERIDYDGTMQLKKTRGYSPIELETDFSEPAYGEFLLFRGDNRSLGNTVGRNEEMDASTAHRRNQAFPPILPFEETPRTSTLVKREKRRANLEGARPAVGKVKARLDLVEADTKYDVEIEKAKMTSLRSFGRIFVPCEVVVRVYVLRGINLQQVGSQCNPYLTARFYGGFPDFFSSKHDPIMDDDNPNFFEVFESRVKMPGGSVRIEVKDRVLPEVSFPVSYPMYINDEGNRRVGWVQRDLPVNFGKLGFGWSETIGETVIDLDSRWYNSAWRSLAKTPVERRSLFCEDSANLKGQLEMFVDIFDAKEVDKRPKMFKPVPISKPPQESYELRVVIYKICDTTLPYKLVKNDPTKLCAFYVQARLGNLAKDERKTESCKYVADGNAEFNWRMKWSLELPSLDIKPRLKLQIFDDTSHGLGDDQLCATADIKLRSLFDDIVTTKKPIIKKKQWVAMEHPNYPDVISRVQVSLELTTSKLAAKKKCFAGRDAWKDTQHEDYILPVPFQPAAFSLINPVPYFQYMIVSMVANIQWQLATVLLVFPFIPMFFQFVFMLTPWQWYAAGGVCGLIVFIRLTLVAAARSARMQAELHAERVRIEEENEE